MALNARRDQALPRFTSLADFAKSEAPPPEAAVRQLAAAALKYAKAFAKACSEGAYGIGPAAVACVTA